MNRMANKRFVMADLVSPLYKYLYGQTEPEKMKGVQPSYNKIEINEIWSPITVGKLIEKFKDIKIDTAARTKLRNSTLKRKVRCTYLINYVAQLLMLHPISSAQWKTNQTTLIPKSGEKREKS